VFRQAPNRLVFNTVDAVHDIYLNPNVNKARVYAQSQFNAELNIFGTLDRIRHRQKRRMYGQVLSDRWLRRFEPIMMTDISVFLQQLFKAGSDPVDMSPLCERLAADVAGQLAFGHALHTMTDEENRIFPSAMLSMNAVVGLFMSWPRLYSLWPLLKRINRKNNSIFGRAVRGLIQARQALPKDARNDFYSVMEINDENETEPKTATADPDDYTYSKKLQRSELWSEAIFIMPAGVTTLGAALSAVFFYLSRHRSAYNRLAPEIRGTFSSSDDIESGPALTDCHYLRAVLDESMRAAPPFLGTFWREPYPDKAGPLIVDGHVIPADTIVGVNPYCIMHNEEYFPDSFAFRPERWLPPETREETVGEKQARETMRRAFIPFALGETGCLGKPMAYQEMSLTIAKTIWLFDFEQAPGENGRLGEGSSGRKDGRDRVEEFQLYDIATADHKGPVLVFKPRLI
jgi:cytochrome P450